MTFSVIDFNKEDEWDKTLLLMEGLFPKWVTTREQLNSWKDKFGMLNPEWFREALNLCYHRYNADSPKPKGVAQCFKEIQAGKQGIQLCEGQSAEQKFEQEKKEWDSYAQIVERDRKNAVRQISSWSEDEAHKHALLATKNYPMFAESNDLKKPSTWSPTFCQFVFVTKNRISN